MLVQIQPWPLVASPKGRTYKQQGYV